MNDSTHASETVKQKKSYTEQDQAFLDQWEAMENDADAWQSTRKRLVIAGNNYKLQEFEHSMFYGGKRQKKPPRFSFPPEALDRLSKTRTPATVIDAVATLQDKTFIGEDALNDALKTCLDTQDFDTYQKTILRHAKKTTFGRNSDAAEPDKELNRKKTASRDKKLVWGYANANADMNRFLCVTYEANEQDLTVTNKDFSNFLKRLEREGELLFKHYLILGEMTTEVNGVTFDGCIRYLSEDKHKGLIWEFSSKDCKHFNTREDAERFLEREQQQHTLPPYSKIAVVDSDPFDLKYLAVPEFQKRGAVHYHCLVNTPYFPRVYAIVADTQSEGDDKPCLHYLGKAGGLFKVADDKTVFFEKRRDADAFVEANTARYESDAVSNLRVKEILKLQIIWGKGHVDIRTVETIRKTQGVSDVGQYMCKYLTKAVEDPRFQGRKKVFHSHNLDKPEVILDEMEIDALIDELRLHEVIEYQYECDTEYLGTMTVTLFNLLLFDYPWLRSRRKKLQEAYKKKLDAEKPPVEDLTAIF